MKNERIAAAAAAAAGKEERGLLQYLPLRKVTVDSPTASKDGWHNAGMALFYGDPCEAELCS